MRRQHPSAVHIGETGHRLRGTQSGAILGPGPGHDRVHAGDTAGAALRDVDGFALGSLCVIDRAPRVLDAQGKQTLRLLAGLLADRINLAMRTRQLHWHKANGTKTS